MQKILNDDQEVIICTQKLLILLLKLYEIGKLPFDSLREHSHNKIRLLLEYTGKPEYMEYNNKTADIISSYRDLLENCSASYSIQV